MGVSAISSCVIKLRFFRVHSLNDTQNFLIGILQAVSHNIIITGSRISNEVVETFKIVQAVPGSFSRLILLIQYSASLQNERRRMRADRAEPTCHR